MAERRLPQIVTADDDSALRRRRRAAQRAILEAVPFDSPAYRRHERRLAAATGLAARVAAYETTVRECGLEARYAELRRR